MIRCHLARLMGEKKLKIVDVARETGLNRNTVTLLYKETAQRIDLEAIDKLCELFECEVGDLLEKVDS
ncbi:MAG: XRE family transcriptional regulator [Oceanospirillaceae bacterium]|nr:XRE family transcriptional regulator [Oceanospirillaceae bacterium]